MKKRNLVLALVAIGLGILPVALAVLAEDDSEFGGEICLVEAKELSSAQTGRAACSRAHITWTECQYDPTTGAAQVRSCDGTSWGPWGPCMGTSNNSICSSVGVGGYCTSSIPWDPVWP